MIGRSGPQSEEGRLGDGYDVKGAANQGEYQMSPAGKSTTLIVQRVWSDAPEM